MPAGVGADPANELVWVKAPTTPTVNGFGLSFEHIDMNARNNAGTQVGSEGAARTGEGPLEWTWEIDG